MKIGSILFAFAIFFLTPYLILSHDSTKEATIISYFLLSLGTILLFVLLFYERNEKVRDFVDKFF